VLGRWQQSEASEQKQPVSGPGRTPEERISNGLNLTPEQQEKLGKYLQREIWMARLVEMRRWNEAKDPCIAATGVQIQICERGMRPHERIFPDG
jgi:hypothetical protein